MESEEGYEGKNLAQQMKNVENIKEQIQEWINNGKKGSVVLQNGKISIELDMRQSGEDYIFECFGVEIMSMRGNQEIIYNKEGLSKLKKLMEEEGVAKYEDLGLPEPEYIAEMEKMQDGGDREVERTEEDLSKKIDEDEKDDREQTSEEKTIEDAAREEGTSLGETQTAVEINENRTVGGYGKTMTGILGASKYKRIVGIPKKDMVTGFKYKGLTHEGQLEDLNLSEERYGTNPSVEITLLGQDKMETITLSDIHEIRGEPEGRIGTRMRSIWNSRICLFSRNSWRGKGRNSIAANKY